jgi:hypothetical protein
MFRNVLLGVFAGAVLALPAIAQTSLPAPSGHPTAHPSPHPAAHATPKSSSALYQKVPMTFSNPIPPKATPFAMSGQDCNSAANANAAHSGSVTTGGFNNSQQSKTFVSVPVGQSRQSVASSTSHAQQIQTCAHGH